MIDKIITVVGRVKYILKYSKKARNNDTFLYFMFLEKFYNLSDRIGVDNARILLDILNEAPNSESIRRSRQKLQELGYYPRNRREKKLLAEEMREGIKKLHV